MAFEVVSMKAWLIKATEIDCVTVLCLAFQSRTVEFVFISDVRRRSFAFLQRDLWFELRLDSDECVSESQVHPWVLSLRCSLFKASPTILCFHLEKCIRCGFVVTGKSICRSCTWFLQSVPILLSWPNCCPFFMGTVTMSHQCLNWYSEP